MSLEIINYTKSQLNILQTRNIHMSFIEHAYSQITAIDPMSDVRAYGSK
jgi:hypothetical protein